MKFTRKDWESEFLQRELYALSLGEDRFRYSDIERVGTELAELQETAPQGLYELELDARYLFLSPVIESAGFRLCDSKYQFITLVERASMPSYAYDMPDRCKVRAFERTDLEEVLVLNDQYLVQDDRLVSKWKSGFFAEDVSRAWFGAWVRNSLLEGALCSVLVEGDRVLGYFIYASRGMYREKPIYKGILSSIDPALRGRNLHLALQEFILHRMIMDDSFYLDNTTQISNIPIVKNHFLSGRHPASIRLIFLWDNSTGLSDSG